MKRKLNALSQQYATALKKHLKQGPQASLQAARKLGRRAVVLGRETLDLARIHEAALATLEGSKSKDGIIKRAEIFFTEAITPIESTHHAALTTNARLHQLDKVLGRRTVHLAASNRSLKLGIIRRKTMEQALKKSGEHSQKLLKASRQLQKQLRHSAHRILSAQERKRKKTSFELQDEIAQTLLGINVQLLTLGKEAVVNARSLKKQIARTQWLVNKSMQSINRFTREFGKQHET